MITENFSYARSSIDLSDLHTRLFFYLEIFKIKYAYLQPVIFSCMHAWHALAPITVAAENWAHFGASKLLFPRVNNEKEVRARSKMINNELSRLYSINYIHTAKILSAHTP